MRFGGDARLSRLDAARLEKVGLVGQVVRLGAPGWARLALDYQACTDPHGNI